MAEGAATLPYLINDADEHSTPANDCYERYIDPAKKHMAVRRVVVDGKPEWLYNGRPQRLKPKNFQVTFSDETLSRVGVHGAGTTEDEDERNVARVIPGSLLNRLNPLKSLDEEGRKEFARQYRAMQAELDDPVSRLSVMDAQGIGTTMNFAGPLGIEYEFEDDIEGLYANLRAVNRYLCTEWGFAHADRIFTPPVMSFVDADLAIAELDAILKDGTPKAIQISTGPSIHTSPFRPELDPFWARLNEANIPITTHLQSITFYQRQGLEWSLPEAMLGDMDAFQWVFYYGDRPGMETVGAAILQGLFARFPNIRLMLAEQGCMWVPYIVRKMDHAFMMGRKASWGKLTKRPSDYFRQHCFVAPYPEENVDRVIEAVGVEPIVFGSDFPHGEGLPDPSLYLGQLKNLDQTQVKAIMHDNFARFLNMPTA
ncbi:MAG: amidohydrolase family protein [Acidimicrobiia bacterium]